MRFLSIVMGIIICVCGIFALGNAGMLFSSLAFPVGIAMLLAGFAGSCAYMFGKGETKYEASWFLSESILVTLLGLLVLLDQISNESIVPYVFGMLVLTSGILRLVLVLTKRSDMEKYEIILLTSMGFVGTLTGVYFFINNELLNLSVLTLVAIALIIQGINMLIYGLLMPSEIHNLNLKGSVRKVAHELNPEELISVANKLASPFEHKKKKKRKFKVEKAHIIDGINTLNDDEKEEIKQNSRKLAEARENAKFDTKSFKLDDYKGYNGYNGYKEGLREEVHESYIITSIKDGEVEGVKNKYTSVYSSNILKEIAEKEKVDDNTDKNQLRMDTDALQHGK